MVAFNKFNQFVQDLANGKHDFSSQTFKLMFSNSAPSASNAIKSDITEISAGNGYSAGGATLTISSSTQSGGNEKVIANNPRVTASGGSIGPFRYVVMYNDTQASPVKPLVGWWDNGSAITLNNGDYIDLTTDAVNGVLGIA